MKKKKKLGVSLRSPVQSILASSAGMISRSSSGRSLLVGVHHQMRLLLPVPPLTRRVISEGGGVGRTTLISRFFHGAAAAAAAHSSPVIHRNAQAARCFSTMMPWWARATASPTSGRLRSAITALKPAFLNPERTFSSNTKKIAFFDYDDAKWLFLIALLLIPSPSPSPKPSDQSSDGDGDRSHCCSSCCKCCCHSAANHRTQQNQDKEVQDYAGDSNSTESIF